jgi:hypothetical protein
MVDANSTARRLDAGRIESGDLATFAPISAENVRVDDVVNERA